MSREVTAPRSAEAALVEIFWEARGRAYPVVQETVQKALPPGWQVWLAVGWGVTVYDDKRVRVHEEDCPHRLRRALVLVDEFETMFSVENELIEASG